MRAVLSLLVAALVSTPLAAAPGLLSPQAPPHSVFRWVDKTGTVHYDDTSSGAEQMTREYLEKRVLPEQAEWTGAIPGEVVAEVKQNCATAQDRLANTRGAGQLYGRDPSGNTYPLSDTQSRLMIADTERETNYWCRPNAARKIYAERQAALAEALKPKPEPASKPIPVVRR